MKIKIVEPARREFLEAKEYYEIEQSGLGNKFATEIKKAIKRMKEYPEAFPEATPDDNVHSGVNIYRSRASANQDFHQRINGMGLLHSGSTQSKID